MRRDLYQTRVACEQEWGAGSTQCQPTHDWDYGSSNGGGYAGGHYWGPAYRGARYGDQVRFGSRALSSRAVARGGFGSSSGSRTSGS